MKTELNLGDGPGVKPLPLEFSGAWNCAATVAPDHEELCCVSTPNDPESKHQVAWFDAKTKRWMNGDGEICGVTFWTDIPASPEHLAAEAKK